jgi:hypothetical protein
VQRTYQGSCPSGNPAIVLGLCNFQSYGCPAEATSATCEDLANPTNHYLLTCNYSN